MPTIIEDLALAVDHHQAGRFQAAAQLYRQVLQADPCQADAWYFLGVAHGQLGEPREGADCIRRALAFRPDWPEARANLANALREQGELDEAANCCRLALEQQPDHAGALNILGLICQEQGRLDEAVACFRRSIQSKPDVAVVYDNLGAALREQGHLAEAETWCRRSVDLDPNNAQAFNHLGEALLHQGRFAEAGACFQHALALKPDYANAHCNLAIIVAELGRLDEAAGYYRRALELQPGMVAAHWNQALLWLLTGDFARGWPEYEWRWQTKLQQFTPRSYTRPLWNGEALDGNTILLHAEQGFGDTIQFIRYAALVKRRHGAATVIVECPKPLMRLLAGCPGIDRLVPSVNPALEFDVHCPLMSLPRIFQTTLESMPAEVPYLFPPPTVVATWREKLQNLHGFRVGIVWQGRNEHYTDLFRTIPLSFFVALGEVPGISWISLQKGSGKDQLKEMAGGWAVTDLGNDLEDFLDTAAAIMNLHLLITCDTAVAHLAGALGVPVWVALLHLPDWRWLLDREDSPWYPTMRLFRQKRPRDWGPVFQEIEAELRRLKRAE